MNDPYASVQIEQEALHARSIRIRAPKPFAVLLILQGGSLTDKTDDSEFVGPSICFWPSPALPNLKLHPGASARLFKLSESIVLDAIGARAESVQLRVLVEQQVMVPLRDDTLLAQVGRLAEWFACELTATDRCSPMLLSAYLRLLLICALRAHATNSPRQNTEPNDILRRFRHLVELHYRQHWPVVRYAQELGVEYDRLHRICKRETMRNPAELVHERLTAEAKARLEHSGIPLKTISNALGFSDPSRFSHFFKRRTGMSPSNYRTVVLRPNDDDIVELRRGFADWP